MEPTGTNGRTRHTLSDPLVGDWVSSCGGFLVGWQGTLFLVVTTTILVRRLICLRPLSGSRTATIGIGRVAGSVAGRSRLGVGRLEWFCGGHGPGETPGPFPNPEAKAWHGDGTALERVWESSAPPHSTVWTFWSSPPGGFPEGPFFVFAWGVFFRLVGDYRRRQAGLREDSSGGWRFSDCGRPVDVLVIPVSG